jgi:CubicO group peptidase (beta-lactamase class C family)
VFEQLKAEVAAATGRHVVPGVAVGVLGDGRAETSGFGVTNVEHPLPVDADTLFLVASNTKTFTATALLRLVEQGKLDLDAPLRSYLPELRLADPAATAGVTLRHTLQHTAGWVGDFAPDTGRGDDALARMVELMAENAQLTPLGAVWSYNNAAFCLAGRAIEVATGQSYEAALRELILEPLRMRRSFFFAEEAITHRVAAGHNVVGGAPRIVRPWHFSRSMNAAGGLISSLNDMLVWARFQLGDGTAPDGTRLLRTETLRNAQSPLAPAFGMADAIGLAWMVSELVPSGQPSEGASTRVVSHGGYAPGQMSSTRLVPERGFAVVVLTNSDHGSRLHVEVTNAALRLYLGVEPPEARHVETPSERLAEYAGRYGAPLNDLEVRADDRGLELAVTAQRWLGPSEPTRDLPEPTRLAFTGQDRVLALDPPLKGTRGDFLRDERERILWLRWAGRIHRREG